MTDHVWQEALAEIDHLPALTHAYRLGELYGFQHAKPTIGKQEVARMEDARQRVDAIADSYGDWALDVFSDAIAAVTGYNGTADILRFAREERGRR